MQVFCIFDRYTVTVTKIFERIFCKSQKICEFTCYDTNKIREGKMTTEEIRKDLKTIRGYYAERQALESEFLLLPHKTTKLVQAYADAIYDAPLDLYRVYFALYVKGLTQEAAAEELNYCTEYIRQKNKNLLEYLRENITERRKAA